MKNNKISIAAFVISLIAIVFTLLRITPFEFANDAYVGSIATFIGISVTLVIGYQIYNTLEIRKDISEQQKMSEKLDKMYIELNQTIENQKNEFNQIIENQKNEMQEGFDIINTLIQYQEKGWTHSIVAFCYLHHALTSSLKTNRTEYEWIFILLRKYISNINFQNFVGGFDKTIDECYVCNTPGSPNYRKELKDIVKEYTDKVDKDEETIRKDENFCRIQMEYDRVMRIFRKRISDMLNNPIKELTQEEQFAIKNPQ